LSDLVVSELVKVMRYKNTKDIWKKKESIYEGDNKVKKEKLLKLKTNFETLRM
jgi:hypothetical protein